MRSRRARVEKSELEDGGMEDSKVEESETEESDHFEDCHQMVEITLVFHIKMANFNSQPVWSID